MAYVIGVDIGGSHISAAAVENGKVICKEEAAIPGSRKEFFDALFGIISRMNPENAKSIGIGVPAPVFEGKIAEVQNLKFLSGANLKNIVEKKFKVICFVENDANAFALAESIYWNKPNLVGITLGTGLGCGIIINGRIYSGASGAAGEISRIPFGKTKLEDTANTRFIKKEFGKTGKELFELAKKGDKKALASWEIYGKSLGKALSAVIDTLNPEIIVLGGKIANAYPFFSKSMNEEIKKHVFAEAFRKLKIKKTKQWNSALAGAALCFAKSQKFRA